MEVRALKKLYYGIVRKEGAKFSLKDKAHFDARVMVEVGGAAAEAAPAPTLEPAKAEKKAAPARRRAPVVDKKDLEIAPSTTVDAGTGDDVTGDGDGEGVRDDADAGDLEGITPAATVAPATPLAGVRRRSTAAQRGNA